MNARKLKTVIMRKQILKVIRDDFNGVGESENAIADAVSACKSGTGVRNNLKWLVANGYLTLQRNGRKKAYTLTEKAT